MLFTYQKRQALILSHSKYRVRQLKVILSNRHANEGGASECPQCAQSGSNWRRHLGRWEAYLSAYVIDDIYAGLTITTNKTFADNQP